MNIHLSELDMFFIFRQKMSDDKAEALVNFVYEMLCENNFAHSDCVQKQSQLQLLQNNSFEKVLETMRAKEKKLKVVMLTVIVAVYLFLVVYFIAETHL